MLEFCAIQHPDQIRHKLENFNPQEATWVVSDLKSKQEVQQLCIDRTGYYIDDSILRVSDFWKMWMRRLAPGVQIVSSEFIRILINQFVELHGVEHNIEPHEAKALHKYVSDLAPLLLHPHSHDVLLEWVQEKNPQPRWSKWISLAQKCLDYIETEHRCIESAWIVSYLQKLNLEKIVWPKKMIFDLGSQMTSLEMGLLNTLSRQNQIEVIVPSPIWQNKFNYILNTYKDYSGFAHVQNHVEPAKEQSFSTDQFLRFNSEINEIKFATAKIRQWIDAGIAPESILVLSPRIEDYWPILKFHLESEGIHTQKDLVSSLISLGVVQRWLATIHAQTRNVTWTKLEMAYQSTSNIQFEKFKAAFVELLDESDLGRVASVKELFYRKINIDEKLGRDQFLVAMLQSWLTVDQNLDHKKLLQGIIKDFIQQTVSVQLRVSDWLSLLSSRLAKKEIKIEQTAMSGVQVLPINSAQVLKATHRLWIGLDESGLKGRQNSLIPVADVEELKKTFDLALDYPEESQADFNLRWYAMSASQEQFFTCAHSSAHGEPLNTSLFFLENNKKPQACAHPLTVVDASQVVFSEQDYPELKNKLLLESQATALPISQLPLKNIAPTDVEAYDQCSFKFLARKGYRLQQYDQLGLEIDPRQRGNLVHDLFKHIIQDKNYLTITEQDLAAYLEQERTRRNLFPYLDVFWQPQKDKLIKLGLKFLQVEKSRLQIITGLQHKTEQVVEIYYSLQNNEFTVHKPDAQFFTIRGRLDRLDISEGDASGQVQGLVIDYKSSKTAQTNFADKWIENSEFQLLIYSIAVEQIFGVKVVGAIYYFYKTLEQQYGYLLDENNAFKNHIAFTKKTLLDLSAQSELQQDFKNRMKEVFSGIQDNKFIVKPRLAKICDSCEWIKVCRVKNLK